MGGRSYILALGQSVRRNSKLRMYKKKASVDDRVSDGDEVKIMLATGVG
jgi:hypothetical protein